MKINVATATFVFILKEVIMQRQSVAPYICVQDFERFLNFTIVGLNAEVIEEKKNAQGKVSYATLEIQGSTIRIQDAWNAESATPAMLYIYVDDAKQAATIAVNAGASIFESGENPFGEEDIVVVDDWENFWWFAERIEEKT